MNKSTRAQSGFTIVEVLVVIAVITILIAILLPALSGAQNRARKNTEVNHLRQVGVAWTMYANNNNDTALPGYIDEDVQERWRIRIEFPYKPDDLDDEDSDGFGGLGLLSPDQQIQITPVPEPEVDETGATWAWRLMPYFDFAFETVLGYHDDSDRSARSLVQNRNFVARHPAFGYNGLYVGGRWRIGTGERPQFYFSNAHEAMPGGESGGRVNLVARSVSQIQRTSELVIFASAMRVPEPRIVEQVLDIDPGYHIVTPPIVGEQPQWGHQPTDGLGLGMTPGGGSGEIGFGSGDRRHLATFASPALIPIGRYNGFVPILRADGSVETQTPGALVDQRLWINAARTRDFQHTLESDESSFAQFP